MTSADLIDLIASAREGRNLEFKRSSVWQENDFKTRIAKSVLAFSNVRDGGKIIIGVDQNDDNTFNFTGMNQGHIQSYTEDDMQAFISEYADPYVSFTLSRIELDDHRTFLAIEVNEFSQMPVICKRDGPNLRKGAIYSRSFRMPESAEIRNEVEMRELLDIANDKLLKAFIQKSARAEIMFPIQAHDDETAFTDQARDLP